MSSENEDRSSVAKPKCNDDARKYHKKSKISYTRDFLLSVAELDACRKIPTGFNISILRELDDHSTILLLSCHNSGTRSLRSNQFCPFLQTAEDGILGSGSFKRVLFCKAETFPPPKENGFHLLSRSPEPYRPPPLSKVRQHAGAESTDQYNDEMFGLSKDLSEDRVEKENHRRDSFVLMRKEQQIAIQEKRDICCEGSKKDLNLDFATIFRKSENDDMLVNKYHKLEEAEMVVAAKNPPDMGKAIQTRAAEFLPPGRTPEDSYDLTQVFIDGDEISGNLKGPKQAGHSQRKTDFTEDLGSTCLDSNAASLDFVSMPQNGLALGVEEASKLKEDDDYMLDVSSKGRSSNFVDNPPCESILDPRNELETKLCTNGFDDICLPEEEDLIVFDDYDICLPEEDDLISFDDHQLIPQEGQYSSPATAKDISSSPDDGAEQVVQCACLSEKKYGLSHTEGPNSCHKYPDQVSLKTPKNMKAQQSYSSILPQLNPVILCLNQLSSKESHKSSKAMSRHSKAYDSYPKSPHCFPTHLDAEAFQHPRTDATRLDYSVNYLLPQQMPIPSSFPANQQYGLLKNGGMDACARGRNPMNYPLQNYQQLQHRDLEFPMPGHTWQCWWK